MDYMKEYRYWTEEDCFSADIRNELMCIKDPKEIEDRFYKNLEFGTGGLRGIVGAGTNRMNIYTVRKASQGVANYILQTEFPEGISEIVIAYDSRRMSRQFALEAASVFAANGIKAYLFKELMPTPVLSFAVRYLHCALGIVITASHNPKEYNGYKVYNMDGGQITDSLANEISECISNVVPISNVKTMRFEEAIKIGLIFYIEDTLLDAYINSVLKLSEKVPDEAKQSLKIVYTPLHGTGLVPVTRVLKEAGFKNLHVVKEQSVPDTEFRTVKSPNPEDHNALAMAITLAKEVSADIVIATDPDSDRLGIAVNNYKGEFEYLNGNQLGCILLETSLKARADSGKLDPDDYIIKTIVTTRMANIIAKEYGVKQIDVLTGFKYIGEKINEMESSGKGDFIFGFEESYGYLAGTFVRDKDAIIAALLTCNAAALSKNKGYNLLTMMNKLYDKYGYYSETLKSYTFTGKDGNNKIKSFMKSLRGAMFAEICGRKVLAICDYLNSQRVSSSGDESILLPRSDVLLYELDNEAWIAFRPSGTEPKLKIYIGVKGKSLSDSDAQLKILKVESDQMVVRLID